MTRSTAVRSLVAIVMVAGLAFTGGSAASAQCYFNCGTAGDVTFSIEDSSVVAGQTVGVSGTGCGANEVVEFSIGDSVIGSASADGDGNYSSTVTIPGLSNGSYTVNASCGTEVLGLEITVAGAGGAVNPGGVGGSGLARTGSDLGPLAGLGAAALVLGAAAVYGTRRRRQEA